MNKNPLLSGRRIKFADLTFMINMNYIYSNPIMRSIKLGKDGPHLLNRLRQYVPDQVQHQVEQTTPVCQIKNESIFYIPGERHAVFHPVDGHICRFNEFHPDVPLFLRDFSEFLHRCIETDRPPVLNDKPFVAIAAKLLDYKDSIYHPDGQLKLPSLPVSHWPSAAQSYIPLLLALSVLVSEDRKYTYIFIESLFDDIHPDLSLDIFEILFYLVGKGYRVVASTSHQPSLFHLYRILCQRESNSSESYLLSADENITETEKNCSIKVCAVTRDYKVKELSLEHLERIVYWDPLRTSAARAMANR